VSSSRLFQLAQDPTFLGGIFRSRLEETLKNANIPPEQVAAYIGLAGLSEQQINLAITFSLSEEERQKFINIKDLFQAEVDESPIEFRGIINEAVDAGEFAKASVLVKAYTGLLTPIELGFVLAADPRLAESLAPALAAAQAAVDVQAPVAVPFVPKTQEFNDAIDYLRFSAQVAANANPVKVPVVASVFDPGGLFAKGGVLNPGTPAAGLQPFTPPGAAAAAQPGFGSAPFGGQPTNNTFNIQSIDPFVATAEMVRKLRDQQYRG
jgi:membrane-associated protease RseP (regulator of RpoE activity)